MPLTFLNNTKDSLREKLRNVWEEHILGNTNDTGSEPAPVAASNALLNGDKAQNIHSIANSLHGLHHVLNYDMYDDKLGLFYNDNSVSFCFEVIPQTGADENMVARLMTLLSPIPPGFGVQWTLFGSPILDDQLQNYTDLRHIAVDKGLKRGQFRKRKKSYAKLKHSSIPIGSCEIESTH